MSGTRPTTLPGIPEPRPDLSSLAASVRAIKEALEVRTGARGDPLDTAVTFRDLRDGGLADVYFTEGRRGAGGGAGGSPGGPTFLQPRRDRPRPLSGLRNIRTRAVWDGIMVLWDPPSPEEAGTEYSSVEIWAAEEIDGAIPGFSQATLVGSAPGTMFLHPNLGLGRVWYYWLRKVGFSYGGTTQYGAFVPSESARGVRGASSEDPELVVSLLQEQITQDMLSLGLADQIALGEMQTAASQGVGTLRSQILAVDLSAQAAIQEAARISARQGVVEASYGVKIDVDGYVAGFGLLVRDNGAGGIEQNTNPNPGDPRFESSFVIAADRFALVKPSQPGVQRGDPRIPFIIDAVTDTVGIDGRLMVTGSITAESINADTIGASDVFATAVWAGIVTADRVIAEGSISTGASPDYRVYIGNKNDAIPFWYGRDDVGNPTTTVFQFDRNGNVSVAGEMLVTGRVRSGDGSGGQSAYVQIGGAEGFAFWAGTGSTTEANASFAVRNDGSVLVRQAPLTVPVGAGNTVATITVVARGDGSPVAPVMVLAYAVIGVGTEGRERTIRTTLTENGQELSDLRISTSDYTTGATHFALLGLTPGLHTITLNAEYSTSPDGGGPWTPAQVYDARMILFQTTAA